MPGLASSRMAVQSAVLFSLLYVVGSLVVEAPPDVTASAGEIRDYFADHDSGLRASSLLFVLAGVPYLVFLVTLRRRIAARCTLIADSAFAGGLLLGAAAAVATMGRLGLALNADELEPATARTVFDLLSYFEPVAVGPVLLLAGAVGLAALRQRVLPGGVGWVSLAYAVYELVEAFTILGTDGAFAPGSTINSVGSLLFVPWALCVAAGLARQAPEKE